MRLWRAPRKLWEGRKKKRKISKCLWRHGCISSWSYKLPSKNLYRPGIYASNVNKKMRYINEVAVVPPARAAKRNWSSSHVNSKATAVGPLLQARRAPWESAPPLLLAVPKRTSTKISVAGGLAALRKIRASPAAPQLRTATGVAVPICLWHGMRSIRRAAAVAVHCCHIRPLQQCLEPVPVQPCGRRPGCTSCR